VQALTHVFLAGLFGAQPLRRCGARRSGYGRDSAGAAADEQEPAPPPGGLIFLRNACNPLLDIEAAFIFDLPPWAVLAFAAKARRKTRYVAAVIAALQGEGHMDKRKFLATGIGLGLSASAALAQAPRPPGVDDLGRGPGPAPKKQIPVRKAKTTPMFLTPAGEPFDGLFYVASVDHTIKRGEYKQSFTLARNGLLSTLPKVPT